MFWLNNIQLIIERYVDVCMRHCVTVLIVALQFFSISSYAQNTKIALNDLDLLQYPLITGSLCLTNNLGLLLTVDSSEISIKQNGIPIAFHIRCPEPGKSLSIVQVLDNSGSMGANISSLKQASSIMIDSMRAGDEMALLSFATNTRLLQDFTQNKADLKLQLQLMNAMGATALYDALIEALNMLANKSGQRVIILISDGADNMSSATLDDVIAKAKSLGVAIYCVGIGAASSPEQELIRMATESGGRYFLGKFPGELISIFNDLSKKIYSSCCTLDFLLHSCSDSLPSTFHIEYKRGNESASFDTIMNLPWRPDTLTLTPVATSRLRPGDFTFVNFTLQPSVSMQIPITYSIIVRYNSDLLKIEPTYAISINTISQGKNISLQNIANGLVRISASSFFPSMKSGALFTLGFRALVNDTSRKVPIEIVSTDFKQGCSNVIVSTPDTIEICQCIEEIPITALPASQTISSGIYKMYVHSSKTSTNQPFIFRGEIEFDARYMHPIAITSYDGSPLVWKIQNDSVIIMNESWFKPMSTDSTLFIIEWEVSKSRSSEAIHIDITRFKLWSRCCYFNDSDTLSNLMIDGYCNRIVARKQNIYLNPAYPNPANPFASISVDVPKRSNSISNVSVMRLSIISSLGNMIALIAEENVTEGRHNFIYDVSKLQSGLYYFVLDTNAEKQYQPFVVVK